MLSAAIFVSEKLKQNAIGTNVMMRFAANGEGKNKV